MMNIKFINATSVQLVDQAGNTVQNVGEFSSPTEFSYSGNSFSKNEKNYYHFAITGTNVQLSGSIGDVTEGYQYWNLFKGQTAITNASNLTLDATTLKDWCYANMFLDCTNLTTPPIISGTSLARWCCQGMFAGCNSLTAAPTLPATTLAQNCYYAMFYGCKSLSASPYLPATTLVPWCYTSMFYNCQNLTSISANFTSWTPSTATKNWVTGIKTIGQFYNDNLARISYGEDQIPTKWNFISNKPITFTAKNNSSHIALNKVQNPWDISLQYSKNGGSWQTYNIEDIIDLNENQFVSFSGNNERFSKGNGTEYYKFALTGLFDAKGNVQSLMNYKTNTVSCCFTCLFINCSGLLTPPQLPATIITDHCYEGMFYGCTSLTSVPSLPATKMGLQCYSNMFNGCTSLSSVPYDLLPATDLAFACYNSLFWNCTSLSAAPELPATTLTSQCYSNMFHGCTNLTSINVSFDDWNNEINATYRWVSGVVGNGTFTCPSALVSGNVEQGISRIPQGWNVVEK